MSSEFPSLHLSLPVRRSHSVGGTEFVVTPHDSGVVTTGPYREPDFNDHDFIKGNSEGDSKPSPLDDISSDDYQSDDSEFEENSDEQDEFPPNKQGKRALDRRPHPHREEVTHQLGGRSCCWSVNSLSSSL